MSAPKQWRVSWEMWAHGWPAAQRTEKVYSDEAEARDHLAGLLSMQADHPPRPCNEHVWAVAFEALEEAVMTIEGSR